MDDEAPAFVDTNVLVCAFDSTDRTRHRYAAQLLSRDEDRLRLSTQVLQEFYVKMTRRARPSWSPDRGLAKLDDFAAWPVITSDLPLIRKAVPLSRADVLSFWDALVAVAAARSGADTLHTEDLNDGQILRECESSIPSLPEHRHPPLLDMDRFEGDRPGLAAVGQRRRPRMVSVLGCTPSSTARRSFSNALSGFAWRA